MGGMKVEREEKKKGWERREGGEEFAVPVSSLSFVLPAVSCSQI